MKLSSQIKSISYLKAHAAEIVRNMSDQGAPIRKNCWPLESVIIWMLKKPDSQLDA